MQVDGAEEVGKPGCKYKHHLEETERALKKGDAKYVDDNACRVYEERVANQTKVENLIARYDEAVKQMERQ